MRGAAGVEARVRRADLSRQAYGYRKARKALQRATWLLHFLYAPANPMARAPAPVPAVRFRSCWISRVSASFSLRVRREPHRVSRARQPCSKTSSSQHESRKTLWEPSSAENELPRRETPGSFARRASPLALGLPARGHCGCILSFFRDLSLADVALSAHDGSAGATKRCCRSASPWPSFLASFSSACAPNVSVRSFW